MWKNNPVFYEDLERLAASSFLPFEKLRGKTVFITGATGLIGYNLTAALALVSIQKGLDLKIRALVRDEEAAEEKFARVLKDFSGLGFVTGTVENLPDFEGPADYIVHAASPTASAYFIQSPVETIRAAVTGTMNVLALAREKQTAGLVYCSSMEVYGAQEEEKLLKESDTGTMDPLSVRNCYPESKRLCENLTVSYAEEYGLRSMVIRLAQTFGPGVNIEKDNRVFAEFARDKVNGKDIVLLTEGKSRRGYLYTMDAISAILTVLLRGEPGQAYNAMNNDTYCSITEMARLVAEDLANGDIKVCFAPDEKESRKFSPLHFYNLDTSKLRAFGWAPQIPLPEMYERMIFAWQSERDL